MASLGEALFVGCEVLLGGIHSNSLAIELELTTVQVCSHRGKGSEDGLSPMRDHTLSLVELALVDKDFGEQVLRGHSKPFELFGLITSYEFLANLKFPDTHQFQSEKIP